MPIQTSLHIPFASLICHTSPILPAVRGAVCYGECPRNRFIHTPDDESNLNYLCAGYKLFFAHIDRHMRMMAQLLRSGHYADEVMGVLAQEEMHGGHLVTS